MLQKRITYTALIQIGFLDKCTKNAKNVKCKDSLTKFVNANNQTHHFLHGVVILQNVKKIQPA